MAKRPRMGRNLNALLGTSPRERSARSSRTGDEPAGSEQQNDDPASASQESTDAAESGAGSDKPTGTSAAAVTQNPGELSPPEAPVPAEPIDDALPAQVAGPVTPSGAVGEDGERIESAADAVNSEAAATEAAAMIRRAQGESPVMGSGDRLRMVGVDQIRRGSYQPRRLFDQELLQELADSIKAEGLIQPVILRPFAGAYELVAGERRWRAAQLAGIAEIPAIIREMEDQSVAAVALIENIQRKDLNPLEEAAAFERLCDEFGMTHKAVAESVGRSRASVTNLMRLLDLHDEVKVLVDKGELEMGHARAILGAPTDRQHALARDVIKRGLTVRAVEKLVRDMLAGADEKSAGKSSPVSDPDIERLSQKLGETLGASVRIQHQSNGRGKLEINYSSVSELQGILAHIK